MITTHHSIEPLEARIAPATLLSPTTVTYHDTDGDDVTIKISKPLFTAETIGSVLQFDTGAVTGTKTNPDPTRQQLQLIDLDILEDPTGLSITITAKQNPLLGGDGLAKVGYIDAIGIDLGAVKVDGDLGRIWAGTGSATKPALKSLAVDSMGVSGIATQAAGGSLFSNISGSLGSLSVKGDVADAWVSVIGVIGSVTIGHDLRGSAPVSGNIFGAAGIGKVTIHGSVTGVGEQSGIISSNGPIGKVTIKGSLQGGSGALSGAIKAGATIAGVVIGGDLEGGTGPNSGSIQAVGDIGPVKIGLDIQGGDSGGDNSGIVYSSAGSIAKVTVGRSLKAGYHSFGSARIDAAIDLGPVTIGGDVVAGQGLQYSGRIAARTGDIASVTIGGSLLGGNEQYGSHTGSIACGGKLGAVKIAGDMRGGVEAWSGSITADRIVSLTVGGSITGGFSREAGAIVATHDIGSIVVKGSISGLFSDALVRIFAVGSPTPTATRDLAIKSITVLGSVSNLEVRAGGTAFFNQDLINDDAQIGSVTVGGNWTDSKLTSGAKPGFLSNVVGRQGDTFPGTISQIGKVVIKGTASGNAERTIDSGKIVSMTIGGIKQPLTDGADSFTVAGGTLQVFDIR